MNIRELIAILRTYPNTRVMVDGYENGYDDLEPTRIMIKEVPMDTSDNWWDGQHSDVEDRRRVDDDTAFPLVLRCPDKFKQPHPIVTGSTCYEG